MIAAITGSVNARYSQGDRTLLELETTSGLSYEVQVPASAWEGDRGDLTLSIHHHISEASQVLFGFRSREERDLFRILLGLSGVGPQKAIALLSLGADALARAVVRQDFKALSAAKGISVKGAEKICLEARDKLQGFAGGEGGVEESEVSLEVKVALSALGYSKGEIESALVAVKSLDDPDEAIRVAIASLMEA